jgi:hypothetical protein
MKKEGQVTLFMIVGLLILFTLGVLFLIGTLSTESFVSTIGRQATTSYQLFPPTNYLEYCTQEAVSDSVRELAAIGGLQNSSQRYVYDNETFEFYYTLDDLHQLVDEKRISSELHLLVETRLNDCIDLTEYEAQGFDVEVGELFANVTIHTDTIGVLISYPFRLTKEDYSFYESDFRFYVDSSLGEAIQLAHQIVNYEIEENHFDQQRYMHQQNNNVFGSAQFVIEKFKPYPHTLYSIYDSDFNYTLRFGVQGVDVFEADGIALAKQYSLQKGTCCQIGYACYTDVSEVSCLLSDGVFDSQCSCVSDSINNKTIEQGLFDSCNGVPSGSSVCHFEEGVGGRFYRELCVNGETYVDACRDYKQEVCVSEIVDDVSYTQCRPNTALTCGDYSDKASCETHDCVYLTGQCVPAVPLGLPFWKGQSYCPSLFNSYTVFGSFTEQTCVQSGDCGSQKNYLGEGEGTQVVRTNYLKYARFDDSSFIGSSSSFDESLFTFSQLLYAAVSDLETFVNQSSKSYLDPQTESSNSTTPYYCASSVLDSENLCSYCGSTGMPCSEYSCKSLGSSCQFNSETLDCFESESVVQDVFIEAVTVGDNDTLLEVSYGSVQGLLLESAVSTSAPLSVSFQTSVPALCKPTYLPYQSFSELSVPDLSYGSYSLNHSFTLRFVNDLPVFDLLVADFVGSAGDDFVSLVIDYYYQIEQLQLKYPYVPKYHSSVFTLLETFVNAYLDERISPVIDQLISHLAEDRYSVFFTCTDSYGTALSGDSLFVSFFLNHTCVDSTDLILNVTGGTHGFVTDTAYVYTSVLSDCRYSFSNVSVNDMQYAQCSQNEFSFSSAYDGYYECKIPVNESVSSVFVQCQSMQQDSCGAIVSELAEFDLPVVEDVSIVVSTMGDSVFVENDDRLVSCSVRSDALAGIDLVLNSNESAYVTELPAFTRDSLLNVACETVYGTIAREVVLYS